MTSWRGTRQTLIQSIESCAIQTLDGNKGRSNRKTSILHGAIEKYINATHEIRWMHEEKIEGNNQEFNVDMMAKGKSKDVAILLKMPMRSLNKNKKNMLTNAWGEAIRTAVIRERSIRPLCILSVMIYPTKDIIVRIKNTKGGGGVGYTPFSLDSSQIYQMGYDLIKENPTFHRHVSFPFEYSAEPTLKTLKGVQDAFKRQESGKRIIVSESAWNELNKGVEWLIDNYRN